MAFLLTLDQSDQLAALLRGRDASRRRRASGGARLGRLGPFEVSEGLVFPLPSRVGNERRRGSLVL